MCIRDRYKLGDLGGIILLGEGQKMYGTEWDDVPIRIQEFSFSWMDKEEPTQENRGEGEVPPVNESPQDVYKRQHMRRVRTVSGTPGQPMRYSRIWTIWRPIIRIMC